MSARSFCPLLRLFLHCSNAPGSRAAGLPGALQAAAERIIEHARNDQLVLSYILVVYASGINLPTILLPMHEDKSESFDQLHLVRSHQ